MAIFPVLVAIEPQQATPRYNSKSAHAAKQGGSSNTIPSQADTTASQFGSTKGIGSQLKVLNPLSRIDRINASDSPAADVKSAIQSGME
ncbi:MAG: hypothetical protein ACRCYS_04885 [Beijerinckiaceae bacterium]